MRRVGMVRLRRRRWVPLRRLVQSDGCGRLLLRCIGGRARMIAHLHQNHDRRNSRPHRRRVKGGYGESMTCDRKGWVLLSTLAGHGHRSTYSRETVARISTWPLTPINGMWLHSSTPSRPRPRHRGSSSSRKRSWPRSSIASGITPRS
jgi:hypothetical protein